MRKILFNQSKFPKTEIKEKLYDFYSTYLELNGREKDVEEVVIFSKDYYLSENAFPTPNAIRDRYKFRFDEEEIDDEAKFIAHITEENIDIRNLIKSNLSLEYMKEGTSSVRRQEILDELNRIENDIFNDEKDEETRLEDIHMKEVVEEFEKKGGGIMTNIPEIDAVTMGISSGKICVIFAPPGSCKSTLALSMVYMNVMSGDNTLVMSLEIPKTEFSSMLYVRHSYTMNFDLNLIKITKGMLSPEEKEQLFQAEVDYTAKKKGELVLMDTDDVRINTLTAFKTQIKDLVNKYNIKTIYIDFIQMFKDFDVKGFTDEKLLMNKIVSVLRYISVTQDVRIIILSQANRAGIDYAGRHEGTMKMTNISEINNLERYAYYIISLYSNDILMMGSQLRVGLIKHRGGQTIQEAKNTFVIPNYFIVGDINKSFKELVNIREISAADKDVGINLMSLYGESGSDCDIEELEQPVDEDIKPEEKKDGSE